MSTGNWPQDESQNPAVPPKKKSSGLKILLIILGIFGGGVLLCCGGLCLGPRLFPEQTARFLKKSMGVVEDPAAINERARAIAGIEIPAKFSPLVALKLPLVNLDVVTYTAGEGRLLLTEIPVPFDDPGAQNIDQKMRESMSRGPSDQTLLQDLNVKSTETEEVEIRGKPCTVRYVTGTVRQSGAAFKELTVVFPGKTAATTDALIIQLPEAEWNDEEIQGILDSIE
jgi:hypothetical protein